MTRKDPLQGSFSSPSHRRAGDWQCRLPDAIVVALQQLQQFQLDIVPATGSYQKLTTRVFFAAPAALLLALLPGCDTQRQAREEMAATEAMWQECAICHSAREMQRAPIIDGLPEWTVEAQLAKFAAGIRGTNEANRSELLMAAGAAKITTAEQAQRLAAYIANLPPQQHLLVVRGDSDNGSIVYASRCAACHGPAAGGNPELAGPPLTQLEDWFIIDQLRKFAGGRRGIHPDDVTGRTMAAAMVGLTEKDFRDVTAWIARIPERSAPN